MSPLTDMARPVAPAVKLAGFLACAVLVATTPGWKPVALACYAAFSAILFAGFDAPVRLVANRVLAALPVIVLTGAMRAYQSGGAQAGATMVSKALLVIFMFAVLTTTTPVSEMLTAMRRLGMPAAAGSVLALMERYVRLLGEELGRMHRARASRTTHAVGVAGRFRNEGQLAGALLLRSWNRSDRVYQAMLARGFTGDWPNTRRSAWGLRDFAFLASMLGGFLLARFI
ncbi:MAG TPA: energy-coupling factor transporter transmembrane component T [Bryobacteraceae bacterium]|nr:energy-coupling factor transporter transmembrane component T [Bryobacteraceae bacterium]HPT27486.1 energy-coupling factor transporter transmembrane component T [Bryobacteraceae bacterium]